jgi:transcriptional regulator with XRE-family HTH domain
MMTAQQHPVDVHVGKRLRLRRSMLGMSQQALGKATGITFQQVQKYERGINRVGSSRLFDIANALSVPVSFFFEDFSASGAAKAGAAHAGFAEDAAEAFEHESSASKESMQLVRAFGKIKSPEVRKKIINLVKTLSQDEE